MSCRIVTVGSIAEHRLSHEPLLREDPRRLQAHFGGDHDVLWHGSCCQMGRSHQQGAQPQGLSTVQMAHDVKRGIHVG